MLRLRTVVAGLAMVGFLFVGGVSPTSAVSSRYVMMNVINWNADGLNNLPLSDSSELTYFILTVTSAGALTGTSRQHESKFVDDVHNGGKKASFSIGGGSQNVAAITAAVKNGTALINNIAAHIEEYDYDGVTLDVEGTKLNPTTYANFVIALREKLDTIRPGLIIGIYAQKSQLNSVYSQMQTAASSFDWISPMIYDFKYKVSQVQSLCAAWLPRTGGDKSKLLCGLAINYRTGLTATEYGQVLDMVDAEGWKGVSIWQNVLFTDPWKTVQRSKWPVIQ